MRQSYLAVAKNSLLMHFGSTEVQGEKLDVDYLHSWAKKLDVKSMLLKLLEEAEDI